MIQVIKIGGGVLENEAQRDAFLRQFATIEGRRVTDKDTLDIVTMVYGGLVNKQVVAQLQTMGVNAIGMTGVDGGWMKSVKRPIKNGIDYGYVGDVVEVNGAHLRTLLDNGLTPVIAPITYSAEGLLLNTPAFSKQKVSCTLPLACGVPEKSADFWGALSPPRLIASSPHRLIASSPYRL